MALTARSPSEGRSLWDRDLIALAAANAGAPGLPGGLGYQPGLLGLGLPGPRGKRLLHVGPGGLLLDHGWGHGRLFGGSGRVPREGSGGRAENRCSSEECNEATEPAP